MSNRAPNGVGPRERRATTPSTPSSSIATVPTPTIHQRAVSSGVAVRSASAQIGSSRVARNSVTRFAAPIPGAGRSSGRARTISAASKAYRPTTSAK